MGFIKTQVCKCKKNTGFKNIFEQIKIPTNNQSKMFVFSRTMHVKNQIHNYAKRVMATIDTNLAKLEKAKNRQNRKKK